MNIVRWIVATALVVGFIFLAVGNWAPVPYNLPDGTVISPPVGFRLPDGTIVYLRLPILLGIAFIAGWLPTWLVHLGSKATWKRKIAKNGTATEPRIVTPTHVPPANL